MKFWMRLFVLITLSFSVQADLLPPRLDWKGASENLIVSTNDPWITPSERNGLISTPDYEETMTWLRRLSEASPQLHMTTIGRSAEGREINMIIADRDGAQTAEEVQQAGRAIVLVHAGIHSGEIDGKDAGMMLLRDLTVAGSRSALLDRISLLFIPILSVDAHERSSAYNRINQRGPAEMGWRTNARNLNLNRDYAKLETEEVRALVSMINIWQPDLYIDVHVTDGADYQYDITYGWNGHHAWSPKIADWLDEHLRPTVNRELDKHGHIPGPLIFSANGRDMSDGMVSWTAGIRFSNGWGDARHMATILVENHSLKPYRQRVLGTYVFLAAALDIAGKEKDSLRRATLEDRYRKSRRVPLGWQAGDDPGTIRFKGIRSQTDLSPISGNMIVRWLGEALTEDIPLMVMDTPTVTAQRPAFYYVPAAWYPIAERLRDHGIIVDTLNAPVTVTVERYRLPDAANDNANTPFEGRARFTSGIPLNETVELTLPAGSFRVDTSQSLGTLAVLLLEPQSPDSFFQWGYLSTILQQTEYFEAYAMEPLARQMLQQDDKLRQRFEAKLIADSTFAGDARARLHWFYEQSPYFDSSYRVYPIYRVMEP